MGALTDNREIQESGSYDVECSIAEMGGLADIGTDIPISQDRLQRIKAKDDDPKFIVVEIEQCFSQSKNEWPGDVIRSIAEQVNRKKPVGYKGHIPDDQDHTAFPPVHAVWLGAAVKEISGRVTARVKGYILPRSELRDEIEVEAVDGVSVRGDCVKTRRKEGGWKVLSFNLESIDFARKGRSGMPARIVSVTSEMKTEGGMVEAKDIAAIDEQELRTHNPLLVKKIEGDATAPLTTKVAEMEATVEDLQPKVDLFEEICQKLGIQAGENPVEKITALINHVEGAARERIQALVKQAIAKIAGKDEAAQKIVHRLVGEQIVTEFENFTGDDIEPKIDARVREIAEKDETVKAVVSEMTFSGETHGGGVHPGGRSRERTEDERRSRTGGVKFSKRKVA